MRIIMTVTLSRLLRGSMAWSARECAIEQRRSTIISDGEWEEVREEVQRGGGGRGKKMRRT